MPEQPVTDEQRKAFEEKLKKMSPAELKEFQKQQCIFCQIINGKVPSKKIYEDDKCVALMDINPAAIGHVLLLPKEHYSIMPQIPDSEIGRLFVVAKHLSQSLLRKLKSEGTNIFVANGLVAGQKAQHFMLHIIPRKEGDEILNVPEHLVELDTRIKLAEVIGNRLNGLLNNKVKKEEKPVVKKVVTDVKPILEKKLPEIAIPVIKEEKKDKITPATKKNKTKKKFLVEDTEEEIETKKEDVGLDDIANLFR